MNQSTSSDAPLLTGIERLAALAGRLDDPWPAELHPWLLDEALKVSGAEAGGLVLDPPHGAHWWRSARGTDAEPFARPLVLQACREAVRVSGQEADGAVTVLPLRTSGETLGCLVLKHAPPLTEVQAASLEPLRAMVALACAGHRLSLRHERQMDAALGLYDLYEASASEAKAVERQVDVALELYDLYHEAQQQAEREAQRAEEALRQALTDMLTGTWTKAYFIQRLDQEVAESQRYGHPLSLVLLDLDFFKHVNDAYGHQTGDEVLRRTGEILRRSVRTSDMAARFGGEEFALVLPTTEEEGAFILAERIRERLMRETFKGPGGQPFRVTMSVGVASYGRRMASPADLIEEADRALYRAKRAGRNRVCLSTPDLPTGEMAQLVTGEGQHPLHEIAQALEMAMEAKDPATARHGRAVAQLARRMGQALSLSTEQLEALVLAARLHDIGKLAVPDTLLRPECHPTEAEQRMVNRHPTIATALLNRMRGFGHVREGILYHHERMDGKGFPEGLIGEQIPMAARIISLCDAVDSLLHPRRMRDPLSLEQVRHEIRQSAGSQFDPLLVEHFLKLDLGDEGQRD